MVMLGLYMQKKMGETSVEEEIPFKNIVLHGLVNDPLGKKMSKSKGNAVNPLELVDQYGADAVRFALVYGTALGNDQSLSYPKLQAMRNFTNKLWNMARFIEFQAEKMGKPSEKIAALTRAEVKNTKDWEIISQVGELTSETTRLLGKYDFNHAAQDLYEFIWHKFADVYIEDVKNRMDDNSYAVLTGSFFIILKLLHPFMPFVTQEIYQRIWGGEEDLIVSRWPGYEK